MNRTNSEIGSHFPYEDNSIEHANKPFWELNNKDGIYTFSGRSTIDLAIQDIRANKQIRKAYLPSYCCTSMIEPFLKNKIQIEFYDVYVDGKNGLNYTIDLNKKFDIFLAMSYFGIDSEKIDPFIRKISALGIPVIEDITHRLFSFPYCSNDSTYLVASIRKWLPIYSGGYIRKEKGTLKSVILKDSDELVKLKIEAMYEKYRYLKCDEGIYKQEYFEKFVKFEKKITEIGFSYKIDRESNEILRKINLDQIREIRRKNAEVLYKGFDKLKHIKPLYQIIDYNRDCPLFVPVMISNGRRDNLRKFLIDREIYCPVHWPNDKNRPSGIEVDTISLICDQRYGTMEMTRIIDSLIEWEKTIE